MVKQSPDELFEGWMSKFSHIPLELVEALSELANGRLPHDDCIQKAFCLLLEDEKYESCLEIFEAHHAVRQAAAGTPVTTALRLTLPEDWNPDLNKLEALFKRLRVDSLTVDAGASTFPAAGCHCISTLLRGGLSELSVGGCLAKPEVVAQAFRHSTLRSMVFLGSPLPADFDLTPIDEEAYTTASVLAERLLEAPTLMSLAFHDERLLQLRYYWERLLSYRPTLQTLTISLKMPNFKKDALDIVKPFMRLVRQSNAFSAIALTARPDIAGLDVDNVLSAILLQLRGHPKLSSLELRCMPRLACSRGDMKSQSHAFAFASACPRLAHFIWEADASDLSVDALRAFTRLGGDFQMPALCAKVADDGVELLPRMQKMALIGHPLATGPVKGLEGALGVIESRMDLDLRGSLIDVASAIALAAAWKKDPMHGVLLLPATFDRYHLLLEGNIWDISENPERNGFVLGHGGGLDEATCERAVSKFEAMKGPLLELMRDIRQQLVQSTSPLLESNVQAFMQAALRSALPNIQGVGGDAFSLPAKTIVEQLVKEERVPTLVRLAAVNADVHNDFHATSDTAQLVRMEKDRHAELMKAVEKMKLNTIARLFREGAIDIGGRAFQRARELYKDSLIWPSISELFESQVPKLARKPTSSNTSNTSVTTLNTTTTTTTATTTTTGTTDTRFPSTEVAQFFQGIKDHQRRLEIQRAWQQKAPQGMPWALLRPLLFLVDGELPEGSVMQEVFHHLVKNKAFDLFAEAFERHTGMLREKTQASHEPPFKSSLVLELEHSWAPDIETMNFALQRIQVDTLTLTPAASDTDLSLAACHLVATLLKSGTTDLHLSGVLAYPQLVAEAMPHSQLRSLTLHGVPKWSHFLPAHVESYEILASGSAGCTTLQAVAIRDEKLFALCLSLLYASPKMNSLEVSLGDSMKRSEITRFMEVAGGLPALSRVKVLFDVKIPRRSQIQPVEVNRVQAAIFNPLAKNPSLTTLDMGPMPMTVRSPTSISAVPKALVFAASCPSLKHFFWAAIPSETLTVKRLQAFKDTGGDLDMVEASARIAQAFSRPDASLTTLSFTGFVLPAGPMQAWSAALAGNRSLRYLDLRGCLMDATSAATLYSSLEKNPLFETLKVSTNYSDYYFHFEGLIWSIARSNDGSGFAMIREGDPDEALDRRMAEAFKAVGEGLRKLIDMSLEHAMLDLAEEKDS